MFSITTNPRGAIAGAAALKPPVLWAPQRKTYQITLKNGDQNKIKGAIKTITVTDLQLRSPNQQAPQMVLVERLFIRLGNDTE